MESSGATTKVCYSYTLCGPKPFISSCRFLSLHSGAALRVDWSMPKLPPAMRVAKKTLKRKPLGRREAVIIKRMHTMAKLPVLTIAKVVQRHKKSVYNVLSKKARFAKRGPKEKLTTEECNRLVRTLRSMIRTAHARWEITLAMLKKRCKCKLDDKVVRKGLRSKNIKFRRLRSKPLLTKQDVKARFAFGQKYRNKTKQWWLKSVHAHWDLKLYPVYTNRRARDVAAMREVRGAYRAPGQGLDADYVVLPKSLRSNTGAKPCRIAAAVGGGQVLLWHDVGRLWSGRAAADVYKGPLAAAMKNRWPSNKSWTLLEDTTLQAPSRRRASQPSAKLS